MKKWMEQLKAMNLPTIEEMAEARMTPVARAWNASIVARRAEGRTWMSAEECRLRTAHNEECRLRNPALYADDDTEDEE